MKIDDSNATIIMAASLAERTCQLISEGWVKGALRRGHDRVEKFCIHGAINLAMQEMFSNPEVHREVEDIVVAVIVDEARTKHAYKGGMGYGLPAAAFNDAKSTSHEDVVNVIKATSQRLWGLALEDQEAAPISWAAVDDESVEQYLHATITN